MSRDGGTGGCGETGPGAGLSCPVLPAVRPHPPRDRHHPRPAPQTHRQRFCFRPRGAPQLPTAPPNPLASPPLRAPGGSRRLLQPLIPGSKPTGIAPAPGGSAPQTYRLHPHFWPRGRPIAFSLRPAPQVRPREAPAASIPQPGPQTLGPSPTAALGTPLPPGQGRTGLRGSWGPLPWWAASLSHPPRGLGTSRLTAGPLGPWFSAASIPPWTPRPRAEPPVVLPTGEVHHGCPPRLGTAGPRVLLSPFPWDWKTLSRHRRDCGPGDSRNR